MSKNVAVITDSVANLTPKIVEQYRIGIVPIMLLIQGKIYRDGVDITPTEAYKLFLQDPESFNTSPASPGHFLEAYREASKQAKNIFCTTLSSKLSIGYQMACVAKEQARTELPEICIEVMDSQNVTAAEGFVALAAARLAEEGKNLAEVAKLAEEIRAKVSFFIFLDTIRHVYRTGRIPKVASQIGSILNVRPILTSSSGLIRFKGVVKSREQGISRLIEILREKVGKNPVHIAVMHAFASEEAERLQERVFSEFVCSELFITEFSPVMGYATGTGTLGLAFYQD
ncbi:DegV family protein [Chloroflexota bacterium]